MSSFINEEVGPYGPKLTQVDPVILYGVAFFCASLAFCMKSLFAAELGTATAFVAVIGNATCGWSWLATRSLFRRSDEDQKWWPACAVVIMMASSAVASLGLIDGMALRIAGNLAKLGSSAMLLLAVAEPLHGWANEDNRKERQFRLSYAAIYVAILMIAVLAVDGAPESSEAFRSGVSIKVSCAIAAVFGYALALRYRRDHPLNSVLARPVQKPAALNPELGEQLVSLIFGNRLYMEAELRVADLAKLAGAPEYKVTQCITGTLGFRNFNQMMNSYRIEEAKRRLADPKLAHLPILTIALDCGFGSIGPFNRAFKADTGMTPLEYRRR